MKVIKWLDDHFEEFLMVIALVVITLVSFIQVVIRKIPFIPSLKWAEEFCRFIWIWSVFLSLPYTIKRSSMLRVTVLLDAMPEKVRKIFNIFVDVVTIVVMVLLFYHCLFGKKALLIRIISRKIKSTAMLWPMWVVYISMPVGFFLGAVRGIQVLVEHIKNFSVHQLTALEQTIADAAEEVAAAKGAEGIIDTVATEKEA